MHPHTPTPLQDHFHYLAPPACSFSMEGHVLPSLHRHTHAHPHLRGIRFPPPYTSGLLHLQGGHVTPPFHPHTHAALRLLPTHLLVVSPGGVIPPTSPPIHPRQPTPLRQLSFCCHSPPFWHLQEGHAALPLNGPPTPTPPRLPPARPRNPHHSTLKVSRRFSTFLSCIFFFYSPALRSPYSHPSRYFFPPVPSPLPSFGRLPPTLALLLPTSSTLSW